jgi:large subunit ribosomal protein L15
MKTKKRRKSSRMPGSHTNGRGFKKKARGSGHRGGVGMAGSGKRGDQKKTLVLNLYGGDYFGKDRALRRPKRIKLKSINVGEIQQRLKKDEKSINLKGYKILGEGELTAAIKITASAASKSAIDKIKKAGAEIIIENASRH